MNSIPLYLLLIVDVDVSLDITNSAAVSNHIILYMHRSRVSQLSTLVIWGWMIFAIRGDLRITGCLAISLSSLYLLPVAPHPKS